MKRRIFLGTAAGAALAAGNAATWAATETAQAYPSRPVRLVVPNPAGGAYDNITRLIGEKLSAAWRQPVIVDNKPGAAGMLGAAFVAKAPGDGYTILLSASGLAQNPSLYAKMPYEPAELTPLVKLHNIPYGLVVNTSLGVSTVAEFIRRAKAEDGKLSYATIATSSQVLGEIFKQKTGTNLIRVPYRGEQPALTDLLGGQVSAAFLSPGAAARYPGKLKVLAVSGDQRVPGIDAPSLVELGYPDLNLVSWGGIFVPSTTPAPIADRIAREVLRIATLPDVVERTLSVGFTMSVMGPAEFSRYVRSEMDFWARVTREFQVTAE